MNLMSGENVSVASQEGSETGSDEALSIASLKQKYLKWQSEPSSLSQSRKHSADLYAGNGQRKISAVSSSNETHHSNTREPANEEYLGKEDRLASGLEPDEMTLFEKGNQTVKNEGLILHPESKSLKVAEILSHSKRAQDMKPPAPDVEGRASGHDSSHPESIKDEAVCGRNHEGSSVIKQEQEVSVGCEESRVTPATNWKNQPFNAPPTMPSHRSRCHNNRKSTSTDDCLSENAQEASDLKNQLSNISVKGKTTQVLETVKESESSENTSSVSPVTTNQG